MECKPKCAKSGCENDGWINSGGLYYCGECVAKWDKKQKEMLRKQMEDD